MIEVTNGHARPIAGAFVNWIGRPIAGASVTLTDACVTPTVTGLCPFTAHSLTG